jgi:uncharacterized protein YfaQ (DUF2300 family)
MDAPVLIAAIQSELRRHTWDTFVDQPPVIAQGGKGVVVPGCPACQKKLYTVSQFVEHLALDVIPGVVGAMITMNGLGMIRDRPPDR